MAYTSMSIYPGRWVPLSGAALSSLSVCLHIGTETMLAVPFNAGLSEPAWLDPWSPGSDPEIH